MAEDHRTEDGKMHFKAQIGEDHTSLQARSQLTGLFLFLAGFSLLCFDPRWHGYSAATKDQSRVPCSFQAVCTLLLYCNRVIFLLWENSEVKETTACRRGKCGKRVVLLLLEAGETLVRTNLTLFDCAFGCFVFGGQGGGKQVCASSSFTPLESHVGAAGQRFC